MGGKISDSKAVDDVKRSVPVGLVERSVRTRDSARERVVGLSRDASRYSGEGSVEPPSEKRPIEKRQRGLMSSPWREANNQGDTG